MLGAISSATVEVFLMAFRLISGAGERQPHEQDPGNLQMQRFAAGDVAAFEALYLEHKRGVYNFCRRMLHGHGDAGEAMQEIFLKVISAAPGWQPRAKFKTWLYTIARNHCHDLLRRVRPQPPEPEQNTAPITGDPTLRDRITEAVAELPEEQREVFVMAAFLEMTFSEIADVVGSPLNTAKSRMRLAVRHLRASLARAGIAPEDVK